MEALLCVQEKRRRAHIRAHDAGDRFGPRPSLGGVDLATPAERLVSGRAAL